VLTEALIGKRAAADVTEEVRLAAEQAVR